MRPKSYIGVTGFCAQEEVIKYLLDLPESPEKLYMIGVLASSRSLSGLPVSQPMRYPVREQLAHIFVDHPSVLNLVHFNTEEPEKLLEHLNMLHDIIGELLHGVQLNMVWPDKDVISAYREAGSAYRTVVLQCGNTAFAQVGNSPRKLAERVHEYEGLIDYVLIDPSGGAGRNFDPNFTRNCFTELMELSPSIGLGLAGNLKSSTLYNLHKVRSKAHDFSIDAESGIRNNDDTMNVRWAINYRKIAQTIFSIQPTVQKAPISIE